MSSTSNGKVDPGALPTTTFEWGATKWLVAPGHTPGAVMTFGEVMLIPGSGHDRHNHPDSEEILYILSGEGLQMVDDGEPYPVHAGDTIFIPTGAYHSTLNTGWGPLRLLAIYNPGGPEEDLKTLPDHEEVPVGSVPTWKRS